MDIELKNPKIFVISGKARSGKNTTCDMIKKYYFNNNKKTINLSFGSYIKEYAKNISAWDGSEETKPRTLLNILGTEVIRKNIDDLFFVKRLTGDICVYYYFFDVITVSDARFKIEIETLKKQFDDVFTVRIERPNFDNGLNLEQKNCLTEKDLDDYKDYDYTLVNDGTLDDLENKVFKMLSEVESHE